MMWKNSVKNSYQLLIAFFFFPRFLCSVSFGAKQKLLSTKLTLKCTPPTRGHFYQNFRLLFLERDLHGERLAATTRAVSVWVRKLEAASDQFVAVVEHHSEQVKQRLRVTD